MRKPKRFSITSLAVVIAALGSIGLYLVFRTHAATNSADFNGDGSVGILDLSILANHFGQTGVTAAQGDANGDGVVNILDLSILAGSWGTSTSGNNCTLYVTPSGGGNGSSAASPMTLLQSMSSSSVVPGSVVCIDATKGTYNVSGQLNPSRSGSSAGYVTYKGYNGSPIIKWTGSAIGGGLIQTQIGTPWAGSHYLIFDGLTIDGSNSVSVGIFAHWGSYHVTVRNCVIHDTGSTGIGGNATDYFTAENNQIYHVGYNQGGSSGISLWYGGDQPKLGGDTTAWYDSYPGFHNVIANNIISGSFDNGPDTDGNGIIIDSSTVSTVSIPPVLIVGNVVYENGGRGIHNRGGDHNVWIVNNTIYANGLDSRKTFPNMEAQKSAQTLWINNIVEGTSSTYDYWNDTSTITGKTNIFYIGSNQSINTSWFLNGTSTNPLFVSPQTITTYSSAVAPWSLGNDLKLQAGSPAINHGTDPKTVSGVTPDLLTGLNSYLQKDVAGSDRYNGQIDIGAYEF